MSSGSSGDYEYFDTIKKLEKLVPQIRRKNPPAEVYTKLSYLLLCKYHRDVIEYFINLMANWLINRQTVIKLIPTADSLACLFTNLSNNWPWIVINELQDIKFEKRCRMVVLIKELFALKVEFVNINVGRDLLHANSISVWNSFKSRFTDTSHRIRLECIEAGVILLQTQSEVKIICEIRQLLLSRLHDPDPDVRFGAVDAVEKVGKKLLPNICSPVLMKYFAGRIGDKNVSVRQQAIKSVAVIYELMSHLHNPAIVKLHHVYKLASACLYLYNSKRNKDDLFAIEFVLEINLIDIQSSNLTKKSRDILNLIKYIDKTALVALGSVLLQQTIIRRNLLAIVSEVVVLQNTDNEDETTTVDDKINHLIKKLMKHFDIQNGVELAYKVLCNNMLHNSRLLENWCRVLSYDMELNFSQTSDICKEFMDYFYESHDDRDSESDGDVIYLLKHQLIIRSGIYLDFKTLCTVLGDMNKFDINPHRLSYIVLVLSNSHSDYFKTDLMEEAILDLPLTILTIVMNEENVTKFNVSETLKNQINGKISQSQESI